MRPVEDGYRLCPDCAEEIRLEARLCRYCRLVFGEEAAPSPEGMAAVDAVVEPAVEPPRTDPSERLPEATATTRPVVDGDKVVELREARGLTKQELATTSQVGIGALTRVEESDPTVHENVMNRVASVLQVDVREIYSPPPSNRAASSSPTVRPPAPNAADSPLPPLAVTNGKAVASLVLGIVWLAGLGSVLAIIFGHMALADIRNDPRQGGKGLATAGLILGYVMLSILFIALLVTVSENDTGY